MKKNEFNRNPSDPLVWDVENLVSVSECTGLVPIAIQTQEEAENYSQLYAIHQQKTAWSKEMDSVNKDNRSPK